MKNIKVAKNAGWIIGIQIIKSIMTLVIGMITARYLGPSNYGLINYASSVVAFVAPLMYLGLNGTLVREIVDDPDNTGETLGTAVALSGISSICCIIGIAAFTMVANPGEKETLIVSVLYSVLLIFQSLDLIQYWFQAKLLSKYTSIVSLISYLVVSLYKVFLLVTGKSIRWFALSNALDYLVISVSTLIIYRRLSKQKLRFSLCRARSLLSRSKHYIVADIMVAVFAQTDKIMIKIMISNEMAGYYGAAVTCVGITNFIFSAIIDSLRPVILENKKTGSPEYENSLCTLYSLIIFGALLQSVVMCLLAHWIVPILFGDSYRPAINVLRVITWYSTFAYLGSVRNIWMLAENKQRYLWILNLTGALGNVILNLILIPTAGIVGAAVASLITQIFTNVILGFIMKPIRYNNALMIRSLNPKYLIEVVRDFIPQKKKV